MVNKSRIHGEIREIFEISLKFEKSDDELSLKIRKFRILRNITPIRIHGIKNQ